MTAHSVFDAAKTTSDPYDDRPGPWYDMKKVREIEAATGIAFREVEPSAAALFPIMSAGYRHNEEIPKLRKAGVQQLIIGIPWGMIAPHEEQAKSNHGQTLRRLAERGGLGVCEAVAVLQNRRWEKMPGGTAHHQLAGLLTAYNARIARDEAEAEYRATGGF